MIPTYYYFFYWSRAWQLWPLAILGVTVGRVGTVGWQHMYVWQGFAIMDLGGHPSGN